MASEEVVVEETPVEEEEVSLVSGTDDVAEVTEPVKEEEKTAEEIEAASKPGTPDPILQKMQMEQSAIQQQLAALHKKVESQGGQPTPVQAAKVELLASQAAEVEDVLATLLKKKEEDVNPFTDLRTVAQRVLDQGKKSTESQDASDKRIAALEAEIARLGADRKAQSDWELVQQDYPAIQPKDLRDMFGECVKEATEILGKDAPGIQKLADHYFHKKAEAAVKAKAEKPPAAKVVEKPTPPAKAAPIKPPVTPSGASATLKTGVNRPPPAAADDDDGEELMLVR